MSGPVGPDHRALTGTQRADIVVVGGGIAGVTTALRLARAGAEVVVLEADRIASGVTGNTSAKLSALQGTLLSTINSRHGEEVARLYAQAGRTAVDDVADLVRDLRIECELDRRPAVTYAATEDELESVAGEFDAATRAGLPVSWSDTDAGLPYTVAGAVRLDDQIGLHPVRYVRGLAVAAIEAGAQIFEHSRVVEVHDGSPCRVRTEHGEVHADQVVIATHFPILDRGLFFARMKAQRSYCVAARLTGAPPSAMAISAGSPTRSIQFLEGTLVVGGEGHAAGAANVGPDRFDALQRFACEHWALDGFSWRWSAQDPVPYDHLPMIGPLVPRSRTLWVATGWAKWGLTGGTFAARILADEILGHHHEWSRCFSPTRLSLRSTPEVATLGTKFAALMVADRVTPAEVSDPSEIPPDSARIVRHGLGKIGVYRDAERQLHPVSLRCTHLGCLLRFNAAERSWDCPCHGSRFGIDGAVLEGPAVAPLSQPELDTNDNPGE